MGYWEGKLAGFLHDPLDKVLRKDHAEDAGKIASDLLKGANVSEDVISEVRCHHEEGRLLRVPDMAASAANRTLVPSKGGDLVLQNPFSGVLIRPVLPAPFSVGDLPGFGSVAGGMGGREALLSVARCLVPLYHGFHLGCGRGEVARCVLLLPEDTRVPSSPMFSHLQMVSALAGMGGVEELGFHLVYVDIGGVQEFISVSRKTADFWASSYVFSLLSLSGIRALVDWLGPQQLILPWWLYSPLIESCVFGVEKDWEELVAPTVPNSALLIIRGSPEGGVDEEAIKRKLYKAMVDFWNGVCERFLEEVKKYVGGGKAWGEVERQVRRQMEFFSLFRKVRVAVLRYPGDVRGDGQLKEAYERLREEGGFEELAELKAALSRAGLGYESFKLEDFEAVNGALGAVMSSEKGRELFASEVVPGGAEKCSLCGVRDFLKLEGAWKKLEEGLVVDADERLCAPCLLKRLFREIWPDVLRSLGVRPRGETLKYPVPSLGDVATAWFRASLLALMLASLEMGDDEKRAVSEAVGKFSDYLEIARKIANEYKVSQESIRLVLKDKELLVYNRLIHSLYMELSGVLGRRKNDRAENDGIGRFAENIVYTSSVLVMFDELVSSLSRGLGDAGEARRILREGKVDDAYEKAVEALRRLRGNGELVRRASEKLFEHVCRILGLSEGEATRRLAEAVLKPVQRRLPLIKKGEKLPLPVSLTPQSRFALLRMDGDDVGGKWISGKLLPPWHVLIAPNNEEKVLDDRREVEDGEGRGYGGVYARSRPVAPSTLSTLSMVITLNTGVVRSVVEAFGGFLVYSGGDDVLAILPAEVWHYVYLLLRFLYSREVMDSLDVGKGRVHVYGMGVRATASFSVVVAHYKAYLKRVIEDSYEMLERQSKGLEESGVTVKDGLSVVLMSRSAPIQRVYALPNMLVKSGGKLESLRLYDERRVSEARERIMNGGKVVDWWMGEFGSLLSVVSGSKVESYVPGGGDFNFIGVAPSLDGFLFEGGSPSGEGRVYTPISDAAALCDLVKSGTVSSRAFHDVHQFYVVQREGKGEFYGVRVEEGDVGEAGELLKVVLRSALRHKVEGEEEGKREVVEALMGAVEGMMERAYATEDEKGRKRRVSLLEVVPLSLILSRCLENAVLSDGGW